VFAWKWRTEIIASILERSCTPYKVQIEKVHWTKKDTLTISGIHLRDENGQQVLRIVEAQLKTPLTSWLYWFLVPSTQPLFLSQATLKVDQMSKISLDSTQKPLPVAVDEVVLVGPDGTKTVHTKPFRPSF
jgi:hypothetical protein